MTLFPRLSFFRVLFFLTLSIFLGSICTGPSLAQSQAESSSKRRLVERSQPIYPTLGRTLRLEGVVRIEAVVTPDGTVKSVAVKGGHPVLADAAANAVRQWKWERAAQESHELVEVKFSRPE